MSYISLNFSQLTRDSLMIKLKSRELSMLLMHRKLNVKNEDEVIDALMLWIRLSKAIEPIELVEVLKQVNWPYVSFDKMMELFK